MNLAPIVLFVYNRPWHTRQTLEALAANDLANESELIVFADGPKPNANQDDYAKIKEVREIIKEKNWCKTVKIIESDINKGLADSIIYGVTKVVNEYGKIIVLEDDLIVSPFLLSYMNDSLERYKNDYRVGQIGACNFFACGEKYPNHFFLSIPDCWGWAVWIDRWSKFNSDAKYLMKELVEKKLTDKFNVYGATDMQAMLQMQIDGKIDSWAIRWTAVCILNNWLTLYPNPSHTNHKGSTLATHANINILPPLCYDRPSYSTVQVIEIPKVVKAMKRGYSGIGDYFGNIKSGTKYRYSYQKFLKPIQNRCQMIFQKVNSKIIIKKILKSIFPPIFEVFYKKLCMPNDKNNIENSKYGWYGKYNTWEQAKSNCTGYESDIILEKCKNAFLKVKNGEAVYERDSVLFDKVEYSYPLLAGLMWVAAQYSGKLNVIDFGGSLGSTYFQNKLFLKDLNDVKWNIVEQEKFVDAGKELISNEELSFFYSIKECYDYYKNEKPNSIILSGVIQYMEDPLLFLKEIISIGFNFIIIDRTLFNKEKGNILTIQKVPAEIFDASYPCWFLDKDNFMDLFKDKYELINKFEGFCEGKGFIFKKYERI